MKKIIFTICLIGLFATAQAQVSLTPRVGLAMPQGMLDNFAGNGIGYGLDIDYAINDNFKMGVSASQYHMGSEIFGFDIDVVDFTVTPITASLKYILPGATLRPYLGLEGGLYNFKVAAAGFNTTRQYFGLAPTIGLMYPINERIDFFANAQYHIIYMNESIPIADFQINQDIKFIPINLGLSFKF